MIGVIHDVTDDDEEIKFLHFVKKLYDLWETFPIKSKAFDSLIFSRFTVDLKKYVMIQAPNVHQYALFPKAHPVKFSP